MQKGSKHSPKIKERLRISALTRDNSKRIAALPRGNKHWNWSESPTKLTIHKRIHRSKGKASQFPCHDCGKPARDWSSQNETYDEKDKYVPRCRSCHVKKDKNWIKRPKQLSH